MKKEINSKSRRKWIMGGLAAFASVALLTTGFAVWVVGVNQAQKGTDVELKVDTAQNSSIFFTATLTNNIHVFEETEVAETEFCHTQKDSTLGDLSVTLTNIKIEVGGGATTDFAKYKSIAFTINKEDDKTKEQEYASVVSSHNETGKHTKDSGSETTYGTYIDAPNAFNIAEIVRDAEESKDNLDVYKLATKTVKFNWGSYFEHKSPCTYYNSFADGDKTPSMAAKIQDEFTAMSKQLDGKKIRLTASLSENSVA